MSMQVAALLSSEPVVAPTSRQFADGLFGFLDQSHQELQQMLLALREIVEAIDMDGLTPEVRNRIRTTIEWFNTSAREHHLDEERHVFPALLASTNADVRQTAERLVQDHGWIEADWLEIAPSLSAAADGYNWFDLDVLRHSVEVFEQLYLDHLTLEEQLAYPQARNLISKADTEAMGLEMARRRALREARCDTAAR